MWRFGPAGACCFVKPDPLMHHLARTTMTFAPGYNGFKSETILPYFEPAWVRVNSTKCPFHPKISGCSGRGFSLNPNQEHLTICTCSLARLTTAYCFFFVRIFLSSLHIILGLTDWLWLDSQYSQYSDNVLSGYFSTISSN